MHVSAIAHGGHKRSLAPLEWQLQVAVNHPNGFWHFTQALWKSSLCSCQLDHLSSLVSLKKKHKVSFDRLCYVLLFASPPLACGVSSGAISLEPRWFGNSFGLAVLPILFLVLGTEPGGSWPVEEHAENELSEFEMEVLFYLRMLSGECI